MRYLIRSILVPNTALIFRFQTPQKVHKQAHDVVCDEVKKAKDPLDRESECSGNVPLRVFAPHFSSSLITTGGLQSAAAADSPLGGRIGNERGGEDVRKGGATSGCKWQSLLLYLYNHPWWCQWVYLLKDYTEISCSSVCTQGTSKPSSLKWTRLEIQWFYRVLFIGYKSKKIKFKNKSEIDLQRSRNQLFVNR